MIPEDIRQSLYSKMRVGEMVRIVHEYDEDGKVCSKGKDPCMNIKKTTSGLRYYCHRCGCGGFTSMGSLSPSQTAKALRRIQESTVKPVVNKPKLPNDAMPLVVDGNWNQKDVPWVAIHWFWDNGFMTPEDIDFEVHWSYLINRVIFPIRTSDGDLMGYVARNVDKDSKYSKYLTQKRTDLDRLFYTTQSSSDTQVFVEDILSALKVHKATGFRAIALLTTHIDYETVKPFRNGTNYLWLDGDMFTKSVSRVQRLHQLGINIKSIRTEEDPKKYTTQEIRSILDVS